MSRDARGAVRKALLTVSAVGEVALGTALIAVPDAVLPLLLKESPTPSIVFIARCFGVAALALGISWWGARASPAGHRASQAGYLVFNLGVAGIVGTFASYGTAGIIAVLWAIALLHAGLGTVYAFAAEPAASP